MKGYVGWMAVAAMLVGAVGVARGDETAPTGRVGKRWCCSWAIRLRPGGRRVSRIISRPRPQQPRQPG